MFLKSTILMTAVGLAVLPARAARADGDETLPPWTTATASAWANESQAIIRSDMAACTPASAFATKMKRNHWKAIPYELTGGMAGNVIWASTETDAPPVRLQLGVEGWHAIFVGILSSMESPSVAWIKLDSDVAPVPRQNLHRDRYGNFQDTFFKVANLQEDESLVIAQQSSGHKAGCGIGYVKLIPLSPEEIAALEEDRRDRGHKKMTVTCDGFSFIYHRRPTTKEELLAEIEFLRDSDVDTLILHSFGADKMSYPSQVGHMPGQEMEDFCVPGHRYFAEAVRELARKRINPLTVMIDGAHDMGLRVHVAVRPAGWSWAEPFAEFWETPFYTQHPQWRCVDRDGTPLTRMSWAVPEVRKHMIDLLREMVSFGADGANIVFNRGLPVVLYEEPFCRMFHQQYGEDARKLDDTEPRVAKLRADIVTTFMRELRAMLDEEQQRRGNGKRLASSAMLLGNEYDNLWYGIDVRRLVGEELLDEIGLYPWDFGARKGGYDLKFFREVCGPKGVPFRASPAYDLKRMLKDTISYYDGGADGISIWDASGQDVFWWSAVSRFGHIDETRARQKAGPPAAKLYFFHRLGNNVMDGRFAPVWGG